MSNSAKTQPILLAAGGSGGHMFPAFALAEELARRGWRVDLATDVRGARFGADFPGDEIHTISSATLKNRSPVTFAKTGFSLAKGIREAFELIGRIEPAAVVGFGGYPCFPPLVAAKLRGISTVLHEQNAVLGRANRMLAGRVSAIATSFADVEYLDEAASKKARLTGNPVRDVVIQYAAVPYEAPPPIGEPGHFRLLVFGGSQGTRFFSERIPNALASLDEATRARLHIAQQCREEDIDAVRATYAAAGIEAMCETFFPDLPRFISEAHLVIGRAGATSVAELTVIGRPSILVPLPHSLDNDQLANAKNVSDAGGAICIAQEDLTADRLRDDLTTIMSTPEILVEAAANAKSIGRPDAVVNLADLTEKMANAPR